MHELDAVPRIFGTFSEQQLFTPLDTNLGVKTSADIAEVRITSGNVKLSRTNQDGGRRDVVVMDDFLYAEPKPIS